MKVTAKIVNAFTDSIDGGNPAGVVLNSPELTDKQMANITKQLNVSETAFVFPSNIADYKIKFFSPNIEVDLCGHATIATFFTMALDELFELNELGIISLIEKKFEFINMFEMSRHSIASGYEKKLIKGW